MLARQRRVRVEGLVRYVPDAWISRDQRAQRFELAPDAGRGGGAERLVDEMKIRFTEGAHAADQRKPELPARDRRLHGALTARRAGRPLTDCAHETQSSSPRTLALPARPRDRASHPPASQPAHG